MSGGRSRTAVVVCLLAALTLVISDVRGSALGGRLRSVAATAFGPAERVLSAGIGPVHDFGNDPSGATGGQSIAALAADNEALRAQLAALARARLDRAELEGLVADLATIAPPAGYQQVRTRVIAVAPPTDLVAAVTLDAGSNDGVAAGAAVASAAGLVGVVDSVSPNTATVRLVSDAASCIGARVSPTKEVGFFRGAGIADRGKLELLDPLGAMGIGDLVVTLGSHNGAPFPRGLPIGRITQITGSAVAVDRRAVVATTVDSSAVDEVVVLVALTPPDQPVGVEG